MTLDLNSAPTQRGFDLIPAGTIATVQMVVRQGGAGEDGWLKRSSNGACEGLDIEYVIVDGPFARRKLWQFAILSGTTDGHVTAADITRGLLRGILESARGIKSTDTSPEAQAKRQADIGDFNNLRFLAKISVEKSKDPAYPDKNRLEAITPDSRQWGAVEQIAGDAQATLPGIAEASMATAKSAQPVNRPAWAEG